MHSNLNRFWFSIFLIAITTCNSKLFAQNCGTAGAIPSNFSTWNWEEPEQDAAGNFRQQYCDTWRAVVSTGTSVTRYPMGAPWVAVGAPSLQQILFTQDYKKSNGWELLKLDFGGRGGTAIPYFVLYHKPTGVLRVFAYIVTTNNYNQVVFTMTHSPNDKNQGGHSTGNISLAQPLVTAADKYISQAPSDQEVMTYVSFYGGGQKWAMGQFTMLFDPNTGNSGFNLSSYQFQVHGVLSADVKLSGSFQFKTNVSETSDFSFAGPASKTQPDKSPGASADALVITATGQKFLGDLSSIGTKLDDITKKSAAFTTLIGPNPTGVFKDLQNISDGINKVATNKTLNTITAFAGQLGGFFSLAGSVISLFTDDGNGSKAAFVPTVSKGTITMNGTIVTKSPLTTFFLLTPGTNHYAANSGSTATPSSYYSQLPYYNCPLGIFNIRNTPLLEKVDYQRAVTLTGSSGALMSTNDTGLFNSYRIKNDIKPVINAGSGLEIVSVKFAIAQKVPMALLQAPYTDSYSTGQLRRTYSFIYAQVANGQLEAYPLDPGTSINDATVILQTPFMDAACMSYTSAMPFNAPAPTVDAPVFVRVIAELKPINASATVPHTYFSQDYQPDLVNDPNSPFTYTNGKYVGPDNPGPYTIQYKYGYKAPASIYAINTVKTAQYSYDSSNLSEIASNTLLFAQGSSAFVQNTSSTPVLFYATNSIGIQGDLTVTSGSEFVISTAVQATGPGGGWYSCTASPSSYDVVTPQCGYDSNANRMASTLSTVEASASIQVLKLSPNPASVSVLAQLSVPNSECIQQISVLNIKGQIVWTKELDCSHVMLTEISLNKWLTGMYIVRVTTSSKVYTSKLIVD